MNEACSEISPLLPSLVADSLGSGERFRTLHHLRNCADCRADLAFFTKLGMQATQTLGKAAPVHTLDLALGRLHRNLAKEHTAKEIHLAPGLNLVIASIWKNQLTPLAVTASVLQMVKGYCARPIVDAIRRGLSGLSLANKY